MTSEKIPCVEDCGPWEVGRVWNLEEGWVMVKRMREDARQVNQQSNGTEVRRRVLYALKKNKTKFFLLEGKTVYKSKKKQMGQVR